MASHITSIREIPDHATFREKVKILGWLDKLWVFSLWTYVIMPTLTTCSFQRILFSKNMNINKKCIEYSLSHDVIQLGTFKPTLYFKDIFENKKLTINSSQWEGLLRPYQHYVMGR